MIAPGGLHRASVYQNNEMRRFALCCANQTPLVN
jgi:hypothetical protein